VNVALRSGRIDILSICTGGAGLDLGVELAIPGARVVCMVEREAFAVAHLVICRCFSEAISIWVSIHWKAVC
jgi:DNA (cytosine-5)-methyltransferase 1